MVTEEKNPQSEESKDESAQEDLQAQLDALKAEKEALTAERDKIVEEAKAHQRNVNKKSDEISKFDQRFEALEKRIEVMTSMLADVVDRDSENIEETPRKRRSEEYLSRLPTREQEEQAKQKASYDALMKIAQDADKVARDAGLDMVSSPELEKAHLYFRAGDGDKGLEEVKKVVSQKTEANKEPDEDKINKLVEEKLRKVMEEKGLLDVETGGPSAASDGWKEIQAKYAAGEISHEKYEQEGKKRDKRLN